MANKLNTDKRQQQTTNRDSQSASRGVNTPNTTGAGETSSTPSYGNGGSQSSQGIKSGQQNRNSDK